MTDEKDIVLVSGIKDGETCLYIKPGILNAGCPFVVTDRDGALYRKYGQELKNRGYSVKQVDFTGMIDPRAGIAMDPSAVICKKYRAFLKGYRHEDEVPDGFVIEEERGYDPFDHICEDRDIEILAGIIAESAFAGSPLKEAGMALLAALIAYLYDYTIASEQTFYNVIRLLKAGIRDADDADRETVLDLLFGEVKKYEDDSFACINYGKYKEKAPLGVREDTIISCLAGLQIFAGKDFRLMMKADSFSLEDMKNGLSALFVILPSEDRSCDLVATILYAQFFEALDRDWQPENGRAGKDGCGPRILIMPDEFTNIAKIPDIREKLKRLGDRDISVMITVPAARAWRYARRPDWEEITEAFSKSGA